jgi:hypothetical protein
VGPFQYESTPRRIHERFLSIASLYLYHAAFVRSRDRQPSMSIEAPLTLELLDQPAWQSGLAALFDNADQLARAYVERLDDDRYVPEMVIYGPREATETAYRKSVDRSPYSDPTWYEEWFIPQHQLHLALEGANTLMTYGGRAHVRKVTDDDGRDL